MAAPEQFTGYAALSLKEGQAYDLKSYSYTPQQWKEDLVDIKVECCGICGSCVHTVTNGWGGTKYPCIAGHEVVGHVVRAGAQSGREVGQRVGVGAQSGSCGKCDSCTSGYDNYCLKGNVGTYNGKWTDGSQSQGGYSDYIRVQGRFAIPIPDKLRSQIAAPMMCGGITVYAPLKNHGAGPGKRVGIAGIGGLGHFGVLFAKALGAEVYAISHSESKKADAAKLGIKPENFLVPQDPRETAKKYRNTLDIILVTSFAENLPIQRLYFPMLRPGGKVILVGIPEKGLPALPAFGFIGKGLSLVGSSIGSPDEIAEMLQLAVDQNIESWIEERPMSTAAQSLKDLGTGSHAPRYRFVLNN